MSGELFRGKVEVAELRHARRFFNLADEPWIPVLRAGERDLVGLTQAFTGSTAIDGLAIVDPLARMAVWRFLIAVAHLIADADTGFETSVETGAGFDPAAVAAVLDAHRDRLWLLDPDHPFAQNLNPSILDPGTTVEVNSLGALLLDVPAGSTKAWFSRPGDAPAYLSPPEAAVALLARWFYSPPGNSPHVKNPTLGALKRSEGGRALWSIRDLTHMVRVGDNLFVSLAANVTPVSGTVALFDDRWLAPVGPIAVANDRLLASTVTGAGALLVDDGTGAFSQVVTGPAPTPKDALKELMARDDPAKDVAGWQDPQMTVVRASKPAKTGPVKTEDHRVMAPAATSWRFLHQYTTHQLNPKATAQVLGVAAAQNLRFPAAARHAGRLDIVTVEMGGATTGPVFVQVTDLSLDAGLFVTDPAKAQEAHDLLELVYGTRSALGAVRYAAAVVTGEQAKKDRSQACTAIQRHAERALLTRIDEATAALVAKIASAATSPALTDPEILAFERAVWDATLAAFDTATAHLRGFSHAERLADARMYLRSRRPRTEEPAP